jgi:hypothetical protein
MHKFIFWCMVKLLYCFHYLCNLWDMVEAFVSLWGILSWLLFYIFLLIIYLFIYWDTNRKENILQNQDKRPSQQLNPEILSCFVQVRKSIACISQIFKLKKFWHVAEVWTLNFGRRSRIHFKQLPYSILMHIMYTLNTHSCLSFGWMFVLIINFE